MGDLADSKRNMKIDFRPRAVMRIMRLELIIAGAALCMWIGMPVYFLKIKPKKDEFMEEYELKKIETEKLEEAKREEEEM